MKYQPLTDYEAQRRGGKGKSAARIKEEDFIDRLLVAPTPMTPSSASQAAAVCTG